MDETECAAPDDRPAGIAEDSVVAEACPNCGAAKQGRFCAVCGQNDRDYLSSWFPVVSQILAETFEADSRVVRTLRALILRPGHLSLEFSLNRRARYLSPFRLYLFTSLLFFLVLSLNVEGDGQRLVDVTQDGVAESPEQGGSQSGDRRSPGAPIRIDLDPRPKPETEPGSPETKLSTAEVDERVAALKRILDEARQRRVDEVMRGPETSVSRLLIVGIARAVDPEERDLDALGRYVVNQMVDVADAPWPIVRDRFVGYLPAAMFFVLPLYALMLKVLYVRRRRFYAEHLVFSMHIHTVVFMVFGFMLVRPESWPEWLDAVPMLALSVYYFIALKRFYGTGVVVTLLAFGSLTFLYSLLLAATLGGALVAVVLLF